MKNWPIDAERILAGKLFQTRGPVTAKLSQLIQRGHFDSKFQAQIENSLPQQKNSRILMNLPKLKKIRKNSYKNSLNARLLLQVVIQAG